MSRPDLMAAAEAERADLLAVLVTLNQAQWSMPSLCQGWTVRDVAAHVVSYDELSTPELIGTFLRGGLGRGPVNEVALRRYREFGPTEVLELLSRNLRPRGLPSGFKGGIALTDGTIHHQDIRRALGIARTIPAERLIPVLDFAAAAPTLPAKSNIKGLKLTATDLDWGRGHGPEVTGTGEALLLAMAGRPVTLQELRGPGLAALKHRVNGT